MPLTAVPFLSQSSQSSPFFLTTTLSTISNEKADAYLLSESSMFVYEYQVVIKTCGTTTLLNCLDKLLQIAAKVGLRKVDDVFYNRQNFFFPEKQLEPHQGFKAECRILDQYFSNGGAYIVGRVNENHYNFYNAECKMNRSDPAMLERDSTVEILMTGLDPAAMRNFYYQEGVTTKEIRERTGIAEFFPNALIDDFMFEPFGYSLNGLLPDGYFTIHITPQPNCSFVSFETNVVQDDYTELILRVLKAFQPERFIIAHLANSLATTYLKSNTDHYRGFDTTKIVEQANFKVTDDIFCHFEHYDLFFMQYTKSKPSSPTTKPDIAIGSKRRLDTDGTILKGSPYIKPMAEAAAAAGVELDENNFLMIPGLHPSMPANGRALSSSSSSSASAAKSMFASSSSAAAAAGAGGDAAPVVKKARDASSTGLS